MRTIYLILWKEFLQVFRNKQMLPIIFLLPIVQLLLLAHAATFEINHVDMYILDQDKSSVSRKITDKFLSSGYFTLAGTGENKEEALEYISGSKARMVLEIPSYLERDVYRGEKQSVQFIIDAVDGMAAGIIQSYAAMIMTDLNIDILSEFIYTGEQPALLRINIIPKYWYNLELDYTEYMVPGILAILVTFISLFLASMNIVREKEIGTIEQLNVTPIRKYQFIIGKLLPFLFIALFELAFGLIIAKMVFFIPIRGSLLLLFGMTTVYLSVVLSLGLFISTITETQQQAMFISWFFALIFILMSGLFTPLDSMPEWAQNIAYFNPVAHYVEIMRRVLLKGSGFYEIREQFVVMSAYGIALIALSTWRYRKYSS
jgi:ABC-2 type transport system permease protein